jgi:predicted  nucleic acid-binding Zn-ribbon protein
MVEQYLSERQEKLEKAVRNLMAQVQEMNEHISEQEQEIIRLNEKVVKAEAKNIPGQLDELRADIEALEADDADLPDDFRTNAAKAIEEIQDTFRNNEIILIQDDVVRNTLYRKVGQ